MRIFPQTLTLLRGVTKSKSCDQTAYRQILSLLWMETQQPLSVTSFHGAKMLDGVGDSNFISNGVVNGDSCSQARHQSTFVSRPNPVTGKMDWVLQDEDYDYEQEIARSGYGDMLHDTDRNAKYFAAIRAAVQLLKSKGEKVKVLDIGTGTGLLSMMAVHSGADSVTACEAFPPMAECARKVIAANGMTGKIKLIPKRSTEVLLGEDMPEKANLLVTELFDTELIGEAAILSYTDAHSRLMEPESLAVPTLGRIFIQAVQSATLRQFNTMHPVPLSGGATLSLPDSFVGCSGAPSLHDVQIDQLESELTLLSEPAEVFRFDFSCHSGLPKAGNRQLTFTSKMNGQLDAWVMWWDLQMDPQADIWLSCGPRWAREDSEPVPWRDHWMQAVYYPSKPLSVLEGQPFPVCANHDDFSLWFDTQDSKSERPVCECGLHVTLSRSRLAQMNSEQNIHIYTESLRKRIGSSTTCLVISEGSLLPMIAASLGCKKVLYLDPNLSSRRVSLRLLDSNPVLAGRITLLDKEPEDVSLDHIGLEKIDIVIAEPYTMGAQLPWQNVYFWYAVSAMKDLLAPDCCILPGSMEVKAIPLQFRDLHKIRQPVGQCEGFDLAHFDSLIQSSSDTADPIVEPQPLWEYPARALGPPTPMASLDFTTHVTELSPLDWDLELVCTRAGDLNGIAFWTEYDFGFDLRIQQGVLDNDWQGNSVRWDKCSRQGVHLFPKTCSVLEGSRIKVKAKFAPTTGDFNIQITPDDVS